MRNLFSTLYLSLLWFSLISCFPRQESDYWSLVDENAELIYETPNKPQTDSLLSPFFKVSATSFIVARQGVSKKESELLYSFRIPEKEYQALTAGIVYPKGQKVVTRVYNGYQINEAKSPDNKSILAYAYVNGIFVISRSSFLVENSIRTYETESKLNFKTANRSLFRFASLKSDAGDLYLNYQTISSFFPEGLTGWKSIPLLTDLARSAALDVNAFDDRISLSGFTLDSVARNRGLVLFQNQQPVKIDLMRLIPASASWVVHYGISDSKKFPGLSETSNFLGDEVAVCSVVENKYLLFLEVKNTNFPDVGNRLENYSGYEIYAVENAPFLKPLQPLLPPDSMRFITQLESYLVLAQDESSIKAMIDEVEADDTWGRTQGFQQFMEHGLSESNVSFFFKDWNRKPDGRPWWSIVQATDMSSITWGGIQFSALDDHFYTSINLQKTNPTTSTKQNLTLTHQLPNTIMEAFPVKNHANSRSELILQDSTYRIYQFTSENGVAWSYPLREKILALHQIDYLKNGKLQYLIVTSKKIYLIDRLGRDVAGFPKQLSFEPVYSEVVDYDKSRNYRYLMATGNKEIYILDKEGTPLTGWAPKRIQSPVNQKPKHCRIAGKDYFLFVTEDNHLQLVNRRGDNQIDPVKLRGPIGGEYSVETGTNLSNSFFYSVNAEGQVVKVGLDGKSLSSENLVRGNQSRFTLVKDNNSDRFFFVRIDVDKIAVFSSTQQLVFERQNSGSLSLQPLVTSISKDRTIFNFYDQDQGLTYLFDQAGNPIGKPLECTLVPVFGSDVKAKRTYMYTINNTSITATPLR